MFQESLKAYNVHSSIVTTLEGTVQNMKKQHTKVDTLTHYSIIAPFDAFEISCI